MNKKQEAYKSMAMKTIGEMKSYYLNSIQFIILDLHVMQQQSAMEDIQLEKQQHTPDIGFCPKCGTKRDFSAHYCKKCGKKFD